MNRKTEAHLLPCRECLSHALCSWNYAGWSLGHDLHWRSQPSNWTDIHFCTGCPRCQWQCAYTCFLVEEARQGCCFDHKNFWQRKRQKDIEVNVARLLKWKLLRNLQNQSNVSFVHLTCSSHLRCNDVHGILKNSAQNPSNKPELLQWQEKSYETNAFDSSTENKECREV